MLADVTAKVRGKLPVLAPLALEAVKRIDAIFATERQINGLTADERFAVRHAWLAPLVSDFEVWMRTERAKLSRHAEVAKAMDYMLERWTAFTRALEMAGSVWPIMPPSGRCAASPSAGSRGCSPAPTAVASAPPSCTR